MNEGMKTRRPVIQVAFVFVYDAVYAKHMAGPEANIARYWYGWMGQSRHNLEPRVDDSEHGLCAP